MLLLGSSVGLMHELAVRLPRAYLEPSPSWPWWSASLAGGVGATIGLVGATRLRHPGRAFPGLGLAAAAVAGATGFAWFNAFLQPAALRTVAVGSPLVGCGLAAALLITAGRALWFRSVALGVLESALAPGFVLGAALALGTVAGALTLVGFLRAGALLALTLTSLALWGVTLMGRVERRPLARARWLRGAALLVFVAGLLAFSQGGRQVTTHDLRQFDGAIVYTFESPQGRYLVTSAQASFALFADGKLELSTLDGYRYAEALVHPAMSVATRRERVALLGGGKGLAEREVLRYPEVELISTVVADSALPRRILAAPWVDPAVRAARAAGRLRTVVEEPIVWLDAGGPQYDVIIVDVPDPVDYAEAKNFTTYFYARLRARLGPLGVAVVQATSPFRSPDTFAAIVATGRAAGLETLTYQAPLPTFGEWGFVLMSPTPLVPPHQAREGLAFLDGSTLRALFARPSDARSTAEVVPNRLHDLSLLDVFAREMAR